MSRWDSLRAGNTMLGAFLSTGQAINAELVATAGFDYVIIDLEHGMGSERDVLPQLQALGAAGTSAIVRVESHERQRVHRVLDVGAHGVMFPRVDTAEQARACVAAMRYQPEGERGVAVLVRASGYGQSFTAYRDGQRESLLTVLQIETEEAVKNVDEIAAVPGADALYVGPMDLSTSLGVFRRYDDPKFVAAVERVAEAAKRHGRILGILLPQPVDIGKYRDMGFALITSGTDTLFLLNGARQTLQTLKG